MRFIFRCGGCGSARGKADTIADDLSGRRGARGSAAEGLNSCNQADAPEQHRGSCAIRFGGLTSPERGDRISQKRMLAILSNFEQRKGRAGWGAGGTLTNLQPALAGSISFQRFL